MFTQYYFNRVIIILILAANFYLIAGVFHSISVADDSVINFESTASWKYSFEKTSDGDLSSIAIIAHDDDLDADSLFISCSYRKSVSLRIMFSQKAIGQLIQEDNSIFARFVRDTDKRIIDLDVGNLEFSIGIWEGWVARWDRLEEARQLFELMRSPSPVQLQLVGISDSGQETVMRIYLLPTRNKTEAFSNALSTCF